MQTDDLAAQMVLSPEEVAQERERLRAINALARKVGERRPRRRREMPNAD